MFQDEIQESSPWLKPSERGRLEQLSAGPGAKGVLGKGMGGSWSPKYHIRNRLGQVTQQSVTYVYVCI